MQKEFILKEIKRFLLYLFVATAIALITNKWILTFAILLFIYILWIYYKIFKLANFLDNAFTKKDDIPIIQNSIWDRIKYQINKLEKTKTIKEKEYIIMLQALQNTVKNLPLATTIIDNNNKIKWVDKTSSKWLKINPNLDINKKIDNLFREQKFSKMLSENTNNAIEIISPYNEKQILSFRIMPFHSNTKLIIIKDISENSRILEKQKSFVENASHELKTPLTVIYGYLDILQSSKSLTKKEKDMLEESFKQTKSMVKLINDLLFLSKTEKEANIQTLLEDISMQQFIDKSIINNPNINLSIDKNLYIKAINVEIKSLFDNILQNAIKHNPKNTKIDIKWYEYGKKANLEIRDYGKSIAKEHLPKITDKFYTINNNYNSNNSYGLGLCIVDNIVKRHKANMIIKSSKDYGTLVKITFTIKNTIKKIK